MMEGETNFGLREDVARGDHRLGRNQVIEGGGELEGGGQLWPCWGIVNGLLYWDCGSRDASCSLLIVFFPTPFTMGRRDLESISFRVDWSMPFRSTRLSTPLRGPEVVVAPGVFLL